MTSEEIIKLFEQYCCPFYKDIGFWISIIISLLLGLISIHYSIKSFNEAKAAKEEASKAGNTVKRQSIIIDIMEITKLCQLSFNDDYSSVSSKLNDISAKIKYIFGLYQNEFKATNNELLTKLDNNLTAIRSSLNTVNPIISPEMSTMPNNVYFTLEPYFADLISNLGELKGVLDNKLINEKN
jgi:tetrahydromethanopterin S-methyltransferase subunit G